MKLLGACPQALDYDSMGLHCYLEAGLPRWHSSKNLPASAGDEGDPGVIPGSGRSPEGGNGTHSTILAWEIPWTEETGGPQSMGSQKSQTRLGA